MGHHIKLFLTLTPISLCTGCANLMFYYPTRQVYDTPAAHDLKYEDVEFTSQDGTKLSGWFVPAKSPPKGTVVHFHGNAQNMTAHFSFISWLPHEGFNVFVFDYRGYGKSGGAPTRDGIYADCIAALDYVMSRKDISQRKVVVLGQSLGGANAMAVMGKGYAGRVKAIAIDSSFYSYRLIVRDKIQQIPILSWFRWPLSFLVVSNARNPGSVIDRISPTPVMLIHGTEDQVIPYQHGLMLFAAAKDPKIFVSVPGGQHTDAFLRNDPTYRKQLVDFFCSALDELPNNSPQVTGASFPQ